MGKSLKNLHNSQQNTTQNNCAENPQPSQDEIRRATASVNRFGGMNEKELMSELMRRMNSSEGSVSAEELEEFYRKMAPHLTHDQRNKMRSLINMFRA